MSDILNINDFYRAFEDRHRGSRALILSRLEVYLPFILPLHKVHPAPKALDLGCGRGEWLELLQKQKFKATGVDLDGGMLAACTELGLNVIETDAIQYLKDQPDESLSIVSGFHIAEHIAFEDLKTLTDQALRVLKPGGLLILETPNPENIVVGTSNFYLDPTHIRPIPPLLMAFLPEFFGYHRTKILRLQESLELKNSDANVRLIDVLAGVSPDYAVVAQKNADHELLEHFDSAFLAEYGIELQNLSQRYEQYIHQKIDSLQKKLQCAEAQNEGITEALRQINQLHSSLIQAKEELNQHKLLTNQANTQVATAETRARDACARASEAEAEKTRAQYADERACENEERAQAAEAEALKASIQERERQLQTTQQELHAVHQSNHHHWQLAEERQKTITALHKSMSWRITWPMRFVIGLLVHPIVTLRQSFNFILGGLINIFQRPLSRLMASVLRRPQLSARINRTLLRYPHLHQHLLAIARRHGVAPHIVGSAAPQHARAHHATEATDVEPLLQNLPPRARQIYADLQAAIAQHKKKDP